MPILAPRSLDNPSHTANPLITIDANGTPLTPFLLREALERMWQADLRPVRATERISAFYSATAMEFWDKSDKLVGRIINWVVRTSDTGSTDDTTHA